MQYFVRTMEKHKASTRVFSPELPCPALGSAKDAAKQLVQSSDPTVMLQADVCSRNQNQVRTRCIPCAIAITESSAAVAPIAFSTSTRSRSVQG